MAELLERSTDAEFFILADASNTSCCSDLISAKHVDATLLIHFGYHCGYSCSNEVEILHINLFKDLNMKNTLESLINMADKIAQADDTLIVFDQSNFILRNMASSVLALSNRSEMICSSNTWSEFRSSATFSRFLSIEKIIFVGDYCPYLWNIMIYDRTKRILKFDPKNSTLNEYDGNYLNKLITKR